MSDCCLKDLCRLPLAQISGVSSRRRELTNLPWTLRLFRLKIHDITTCKYQLHIYIAELLETLMIVHI